MVPVETRIRDRQHAWRRVCAVRGAGASRAAIAARVRGAQLLRHPQPVSELHEIATLVQRSEIALAEAYQPQGINAGINLGRPAGAGILEHVHVHLVPRWTGDTNFMTIVGDARVLPESLSASAARLRPIFRRLEHESGQPAHGLPGANPAQ